LFGSTASSFIEKRQKQMQRGDPFFAAFSAFSLCTLQCSQQAGRKKDLFTSFPAACDLSHQPTFQIVAINPKHREQTQQHTAVLAKHRIQQMFGGYLCTTGICGEFFCFQHSFGSLARITIKVHRLARFFT